MKKRMKTERFKTDCWLWPFATDSDGYGFCKINGRYRSAYRFMYETFIAMVSPKYGISDSHVGNIVYGLIWKFPKIPKIVFAKKPI